MKKLFIIFIIFILVGCKSNKNLINREECPCGDNFLISYDDFTLSGVCYVPYNTTFRSGFNEFYEFEIVDCKGTGTLKTISSSGVLQNIIYYESTDSIRTVKGSSFGPGEIEAIESIAYKPIIVDSVSFR